MDAKTELISDKGAIRHAALTLFGYYCLRRNHKTGLCFPSLETTVRDTGITPKSNVSMLRTFLRNIAWIEVYENGVIKPLKGFYSDEERLKIWLKNFLLERISVLIIRTLVLKNRTFVLIIRTLFKRNINQPIEPAHLTGVSANSAEPESANAPDDKNFDKNPPAGKPTEAAPVDRPAPLSSAGKPADQRSRHPAVRMVKEITGRFPPKDLWDRIIREIKEKPDIAFFTASFEIWRGVGGNPQNFEKWLFEPGKIGFPPEVYASKNGKSPPDWANVGRGDGGTRGDEDSRDFAPSALEPVEILSDEQRENSLCILRGILREAGSVQNMAQLYTPEDWAWLMEKLENVR